MEADPERDAAGPLFYNMFDETSMTRSPAERTKPGKGTLCYHCGASCLPGLPAYEGRHFCCDGCRLVYEIINNNGLCDYYSISEHPGLSQVKPLHNDKFSFLDNEDIAAKLYRFTDGDHTIVTLHVPGIHCSSCMWLLENLQRINGGIIESRLNFSAKEVTIHFHRSRISLRQTVELMASVGYEPVISLQDQDQQERTLPGKGRIYKLGVAGFCFGNIMMMSLPEYLSGGRGLEEVYALLFRYLSLALAMPVFFYCASEFWINTRTSIRRRILHIDAPIALALIITFARSLYEIFSGTGPGYLDSMTGIVFFMLAGRVVQERTYGAMAFHRDFRSYFPIAVTVLTESGRTSRSLHDLKKGDMVALHASEIIPADAVITEGDALIDYSFVTGESRPVKAGEGDPVYAGGKQTGGGIVVRILNPVSGSYLTSLWNHHAFSRNKTEERRQNGKVHLLSRYFTWILLCLVLVAAVFWAMHDPSMILSVVSAMLIVACPCALLLAETFTNGNMLRIFSDKGLFLRDASVSEHLAGISHIVFDKTGTLTEGLIVEQGASMLSGEEMNWIYHCVRPSTHPYSKALAAFIAGSEKAREGKREQGTRAVSGTEEQAGAQEKDAVERIGERGRGEENGEEEQDGVRIVGSWDWGGGEPVRPDYWEEVPGEGIRAGIRGNHIRVGHAGFAGADKNGVADASVYVNINGREMVFRIVPKFRTALPEVAGSLAASYGLSVLSGDREALSGVVREVFGPRSTLLSGQSPEGKLDYIRLLQEKGERVLMIGDGLNDAGALQQSDIGITLAEDVNNFTPSCDAILDAGKFDKIPALIRMAQYGQRVIRTSFIVSIVYNIAGLYFAVMGWMSPMIAAILMPCSTLSIVLISTGLTSLAARRLRL